MTGVVTHVQCWGGVAQAPADFGPSVVTIGTFDGVHRGHRSLISCAVAAAERAGLPCVALTFEPHPMAVLRPDSAPARLTAARHRRALLAGLGVDVVCEQPFTREFAGLSPEQFATDVLAGALHAATVVVGANFRFGHRAAGDVDRLRTLGQEHGFKVEVVAIAGDPTGALSSTRVRGLVAAGDVAAAAECLGRPHRVEGPVVRGDGRGRGLGYPTANLALAPDTAIPADGVYAGWLVRDVDEAQQRLPAAVSVGTNPTFDGHERRVEAYVLDADLDLYDQLVGVEFAVPLRGMTRFATVDELVAQMGRDVDRARELLGSGNAGTLGAALPSSPPTSP